MIMKAVAHRPRDLVDLDKLIGRNRWATSIPAASTCPSLRRS